MESEAQLTRPSSEPSLTIPEVLASLAPRDPTLYAPKAHAGRALSEAAQRIQQESGSSDELRQLRFLLRKSQKFAGGGTLIGAHLMFNRI